MRFDNFVKYFVSVGAVASLSACTSKPPHQAYVHQGNLAPISQTNMEGNFCATKRGGLIGGAGISLSTVDFQQMIGKCKHPKWNKNDVVVISFGDLGLDPDAMEEELEVAMQPEMYSAVDEPETNSPDLTAAASSPNVATSIAEDCSPESQCAQDKLLLSKGALIHFASDSDVPANPEEVAVLANIARIAKQKSLPLIVVGHADGTSTEKHNVPLSVRRAEAVKRILSGHGVADNMVVATGRSSSIPLATNKTPEGRATNRRAEISVNPTTAVEDKHGN